jgi:hypothetical protein
LRLVKERDADTFHLPDPPLSAHPHFVFGASDAPLKGAELDKFGLVQFPMVMGGIVPVVNIEGIKPGELVLDGPTRAGIFLGKVKNWDDSAIKKLNPNAKLPSQPIAVVHRSEGSGLLSTSRTIWRRSVPIGNRRSAPRRQSNGRSALEPKAMRAFPTT